MYHSTTPLNGQVLGNPPQSSMSAAGTIHGDILTSGTIDTAALRWNNPIPLQITDDQEVQFKDVTTYSGKEVSAMFKMLKKLALEEYPEEFV